MKFVVCSVCKGCLSPSQVPQLPCSKWVGEPDYLSPCQLCIHTLYTMYTIQCIVYMCIVYMCIHIVCAQGLSVLLPRYPSCAHSCTTLFCCYTGSTSPQNIKDLGMQSLLLASPPSCRLLSTSCFISSCGLDLVTVGCEVRSRKETESSLPHSSGDCRLLILILGMLCITT